MVDVSLPVDTGAIRSPLRVRPIHSAAPSRWKPSPKSHDADVANHSRYFKDATLNGTSATGWQDGPRLHALPWICTTTRPTLYQSVEHGDARCGRDSRGGRHSGGGYHSRYDFCVAQRQQQRQRVSFGQSRLQDYFPDRLSPRQRCSSASGSPTAADASSSASPQPGRSGSGWTCCQQRHRPAYGHEQVAGNERFRRENHMTLTTPAMRSHPGYRVDRCGDCSGLPSARLVPQAGRPPATGSTADCVQEAGLRQHPGRDQGPQRPGPGERTGSTKSTGPLCRGASSRGVAEDPSAFVVPDFLTPVGQRPGQPGVHRKGRPGGWSIGSITPGGSTTGPDTNKKADAQVPSIVQTTLERFPKRKFQLTFKARYDTVIYLLDKLGNLALDRLVTVDHISLQSRGDDATKNAHPQVHRPNAAHCLS